MQIPSDRNQLHMSGLKQPSVNACIMPTPAVYFADGWSCLSSNRVGDHSETWTTLPGTSEGWVTAIK